MALAQICPLGDRALLVRFGDSFSDEANVAAIALAQHLSEAPPAGVAEVVPNLVSVLVRFEHGADVSQIEGQIRLAAFGLGEHPALEGQTHDISVRFGGEDGPDLAEVANSLDMSEAEFIARHNGSDLRVLATGFAPGFVYCGLHPDNLNLPRRHDVRPKVPAGTILFAAGQTAITATSIPTGWHVIGRTEFRNFDSIADPPVQLNAGDRLNFVEAPE